jgi:hypothetical protein
LPSCVSHEAEPEASDLAADLELSDAYGSCAARFDYAAGPLVPADDEGDPDGADGTEGAPSIDRS